MREKVKEGWRRVRLEEICEKVQYGYTASANYNEVGPKFLRITDIVPDLTVWDSVPYCDINPSEIGKFLLREGDIVIARTGATVGYAKYIKENTPEAVFASYLVRIRLKSEIYSRYVGLVVESSKYKDFVKSHMGGAAQPNANAKILTSFEFLLPPLPTQRKIASILSAYDDLIENNTRRIRILEEMAQAIYKEWFINFRFPGHEKVRMVETPLQQNKIPEGWEVKPIGNLIETFGGGTPSTTNEDYWKNGDVIWYTPTDITSNNGIFIQNSAKKITRLGLEKSSAKMFPAYCLMMTSRATIGEVAINSKPACTNQGFITCIPSPRLSAFYIYFWTKQNKETIISLASGATYKEINRTTFRKIPILIPSTMVSHSFESVINSIFNQIENLQSQIENLRRTRDLLLPKLISEEIDVEELDIIIDAGNET